jgi:hypothetical protein
MNLHHSYIHIIQKGDRAYIRFALEESGVVTSCKYRHEVNREHPKRLTLYTALPPFLSFSLILII